MPLNYSIRNYWTIKTTDTVRNLLPIIILYYCNGFIVKKLFLFFFLIVFTDSYV